MKSYDTPRPTATLSGRAVDRRAVSFYEINGLDEFRGVRHGRQPTDRGSSEIAAGASAEVPGRTSADPFDIYTDASWRPLIELARDRTDRIAMRSAGRFPILPEGSRVERTPIPTGELIHSTVDVNTVWTVEHLLKDTEDAKAFLSVSATDPPTDTRSALARLRTGVRPHPLPREPPGGPADNRGNRLGRHRPDRTAAGGVRTARRPGASRG